VKETIDATLEVLRAISRKLDGTKTHKLDVALLKSYIDLVFRDCRDDLANPTYTKQAGLLIMTVIGANIRGYVLYNAGLIDTIRQNLRQPKSPSHKRDLLLLLNSTLKTRMELSKQRKQGHPEDEETLRSESRAHLETLFHDAYLPIWAGKSKEMIAEESDVLKQVIQGFALLVSQQVLQSDGQAALLYPTPTCSEICSLLSLTLTNGLALSSNDSNAGEPDLEDEAVLALRNIVMSYRYGYEEISGRVTAEIRKRDWASPSAYSLNALKDLLSRFTFIGCSEIPSNIATNPPSQQPFSPLQHFLTLTASLLELFPLSSRLSTPHSTGNLEEGLANAHIVSSLHASLLWFLEACEAKYGREALASYSSSDQNWLEQFQHLPDDWLIQIRRGDADLLGTLVSLQQDDPEVYRQFLKLSLFNVRYLFRAASAGSRQTWSERALAQLSQMSALVVRSLSEELQVSCNLAHEAFNFFAGPAEDSKRSASDIQTGILTVGILQGLRPRALAGLVCPSNTYLPSLADEYFSSIRESALQKSTCVTRPDSAPLLPKKAVSVQLSVSYLPTNIRACLTLRPQ
jgi:DNA repair/transcription protein MET18/MMS19